MGVASGLKKFIQRNGPPPQPGGTEDPAPGALSCKVKTDASTSLVSERKRFASASSVCKNGTASFKTVTTTVPTGVPFKPVFGLSGVLPRGGARTGSYSRSGRRTTEEVSRYKAPPNVSKPGIKAASEFILWTDETITCQSKGRRQTLRTSMGGFGNKILIL